MFDAENAGKANFNAYKGSNGGIAPDHKPISNWEDLSNEARVSWIAGAEAVAQVADVSLIEALGQAIAVIESYENDIKAGHRKVNLVKTGFCQNAYYRAAIQDIVKISGLTGKPDADGKIEI